MSEITSIQVRVTRELKEEAGKVFERQGLSFTDAICLFLLHCVKEGRTVVGPEVVLKKGGVYDE